MLTLKLLQNLKFTLVLIVLSGITLASSHYFVYETLTSFFLFTNAACILLCFSGLVVCFNNDIRNFKPGIPVLLFILWMAYVVIHSNFIVNENGNLKDNLIIISAGLFIALSILLSVHSYSLPVFYIGLTALLLFESIICVMQFINSGSSLNPNFQATGTQANPNITAMFMAMAFPALWITLFQEKGLFKYVAILSLLLSVVALYLLKCRSAFLGAAFATAIIFSIRFNIHHHLFEKKKVWIIVPALIALLVLASKAYEWKKASADGRRMIWTLSGQMIVDKPLTGFGYGLFDRHFNLYQARYFEEGKGTPDEKVNATHVYMAYNEILENAIEGGIPGMAMFLGVIIAPLILYIKNKNKTFEKTVAFAGMCAFAFMSLVNFSIQAIPVMCLFVIYAAILSPGVFAFTPSQSGGLSMAPAFRKASGFTLVIVALYSGTCQAGLTLAFLKHKQAMLMLEKGNISQANLLFASLEKRMNTCESYHVQYGRGLFMAGEYEKAAFRFGQALRYTSHPDVFLNRGQCYERLQEPVNAEKAYQKAMQMVPSRFIPRYLLMKIYSQAGDTSKAVMMARTITKMNIKVPSKEADFYRREAANYLQSTQPLTTNH